mmetsp:Transcript_9905/g.31267  ORF Transcript_9905/g.31267 Transcript_9905/m.31267 type:complete len:207 (-) Transcript_9905:779-1399(-)
MAFDTVSQCLGVKVTLTSASDGVGAKSATESGDKLTMTGPWLPARRCRDHSRRHSSSRARSSPAGRSAPSWIHAPSIPRKKRCCVALARALSPLPTHPSAGRARSRSFSRSNQRSSSSALDAPVRATTRARCSSSRSVSTLRCGARQFCDGLNMSLYMVLSSLTAPVRMAFSAADAPAPGRSTSLTGCTLLISVKSACAITLLIAG